MNKLNSYVLAVLLHWISVPTLLCWSIEEKNKLEILFDCILNYCWTISAKSIGNVSHAAFARFIITRAPHFHSSIIKRTNFGAIELIGDFFFFFFLIDTHERIHDQKLKLWKHIPIYLLKFYFQVLYSHSSSAINYEDMLTQVHPSPFLSLFQYLL